MVNEVNKLISNTLAEGRALYIPEVGTLSIVSAPATKSRSRVVGPCLSVAFSSECKGESLSNIIAAAAVISAEEADDIVRRWIAKVSADGKVVIEGIGIVQNNSFMPDDKLNSCLMASAKTVQLTKKKKGSRLPWILLVVLLVCGLGVGAYLYYIYNGTSEDVVITETPAEEPTAEETIIEQDTVSTFVSEPEVVEEEVITPEPEPVAEPSEIVVQTPTEEVIAEPSETETKVSDWREGEAYHYVIFGSYSTLNNANVAVRQISRKDPSAQCKIMPLGKMYAVAVYGSTNRKDCEAFKRSNYKLYKNAWIHTPKKFK